MVKDLFAPVVKINKNLGFSAMRSDEQIQEDVDKAYKKRKDSLEELNSKMNSKISESVREVHSKLEIEKINSKIV